MPNLKWTFLLAIVSGAVIVVAAAAINRPESRPRVAARRLAGAVWVTEQVGVDQLADIKAKGFRSVIDLRPDGEVAGQPASADVASAARAEGLAFAYIPVPHGEVPATAVDALGHSIEQSGRPILLYCRSGHRAARTWALAEASRPGGLNAAAIKSAVGGLGQSADDLGDQIAARIAARPAGKPLSRGTEPWR